jgi:hypothetical protein
MDGWLAELIQALLGTGRNSSGFCHTTTGGGAPSLVQEGVAASRGEGSLQPEDSIYIIDRHGISSSSNLNLYTSYIYLYIYTYKLIRLCQGCLIPTVVGLVNTKL